MNDSLWKRQEMTIKLYKNIQITQYAYFEKRHIISVLVNAVKQLLTNQVQHKNLIKIQIINNKMQYLQNQCCKVPSLLENSVAKQL